MDPGLILIFDRSGRMQPSKALETAVCIELLRQGADLSYVRTQEGFEVNFLARWPSGTQELIQVCAEAGEAATLEREVRALKAAAREPPDAVCSLLTLVPEGIRSVPATIQVHDASLWLLRRDRAAGAHGPAREPKLARAMRRR